MIMFIDLSSNVRREYAFYFSVQQSNRIHLHAGPAPFGMQSECGDETYFRIIDIYMAGHMGDK